MPTKSEAIARFLKSKTLPDLADLYSLDMECQVNVSQDGGERTGGDYRGRKWHGWTDGFTTWKSFRIPYKANTDPEFDDREIKFDLAEHVDGIGMTGWDWKNRCSKWVAFDFDAIVGHDDKHSAKLTNEELEDVKNAAHSIEWVTIRKSTSGQGLHIYVFLPDIPTDNHNEHAALARSILGKMSALTGFDFKSKVDNCGGCMWVWHRKMLGTEGLTVIKQGIELEDVPPNWKDHVKVIKGTRRKNLPQEIENSGKGDLFDELTGQRPRVKFDEGHQRLIQFLKDENAMWWWESDHHMLVTHTSHLKDAHDKLNLVGIFETISRGAEKGADHNCFAFPLRRGAWTVRRYTPGIQEHSSWSQDGAGWTYTYLNREPDLATACRSFGGIEDPKGGFIFREAEVAMRAAESLGITFKVAPHLMTRETKLKQHKDGRLIIEVNHDMNDQPAEMFGWLLKKNKPWTKMFNARVSTPNEPDTCNYDDIVRHLVTSSHEDYGWMIKSDDVWRSEPMPHVRVALGSLGISPKDIILILGSSVFKCWKVVNKPFQSEYPGDREWNRNAAQFRYTPSKNENLNYPTWLKILEHCGHGLNDAVKDDPWCKANGILTGADYLKCWVASLLQEPTEPLPYLFFFGPQNSGKSIIHEALNLLFTKGYKRADAALISQSGFNAELEGAIVCVVEETDLRYKGGPQSPAYNRIKDWVTSRELLIHPKGKTPYHIPNTSHWIHCANDMQACPIFPGDTRITMCYVDMIDPIDMIPKKRIIPLLEKEAADFLAGVLKLDLPESNDRLGVPALSTDDKAMAQELNEDEFQAFVTEKCQPAPGYMIKLSDLYEKFQSWLPATERRRWTKNRMGKSLPQTCVKGRIHETGHHYIGNITWAGQEIDERPRLVKIGVYLEPHDDN